MNKINGKQSDFALMSTDGTQIIIGYNLKKIEGADLYEWWEITIPKTQINQLTLQNIKNAIIKGIDDRTDEKILCGYPWTVLHGDDAGKNVKVWLTKENQTNYKAKYDLHYQKPEALTFPTTYKIAEDDDKNAIFEEFENFNELEHFYLGGIAYIEATVQAGWAEKKAIDWAPYEALFPQKEQTQNAE